MNIKYQLKCSKTQKTRSFFYFERIGRLFPMVFKFLAFVEARPQKGHGIIHKFSTEKSRKNETSTISLAHSFCSREWSARI